MNIKLTHLSLLLLIGISTFAEAKTLPKGRAEDNRIKEVHYDETQVVEVPTSFGFATTIEFGMETIQTVVSGDTIGWQVQPKGNRLFIKPAERAQPGMTGTNINVITDRRNYYFHLYNAPRNNPTFVIRYRYDKPPQPPTFQSQNGNEPGKNPLVKPFKNFNYLMSGSNQIVVKKVFDDGQFTYFEFDIRRPLPVIYAVNSSGKDEIVNTRREGKYIVVEKISGKYTLRDGVNLKCIKNNAPI